MNIHFENGIILVKLDYKGKKYLRSFFNNNSFKRWVSSLEGGCR